MKIFVTTGDKIHPVKGGGALRTIKIAKELHSRHHDVVLLAPSGGKVMLGDIRVISLPEVSQEKSIVLGPAYFVVKSSWEMLKNKKNIDLIISHNSIAAIPGLFFAKIFKKKFVLDITDIQTEYFRENKKGVLWNLFTRLLVGIEMFIIRNSKKIIVVSKIMREMLVARGVNSKNIFIVYDGVDISSFSMPKRKQVFPVIVHHGSVNPHDGVEFIPLAAAKVVEKYPEAKFFIIGSGNRLNKIKDIVREKKINNSFIFTGWKPYEEIKNYLQIADIGLITRPDTLANNLILTLKLLEYWASGTAPVSSRLKGIQEVSQEDEDIIFFTPGSPDELAKSIIRLLDDSVLLKRIQEKGIKAAQRFEWDALIRQIANLSLQ